MFLNKIQLHVVSEKGYLAKHFATDSFSHLSLEYWAFCLLNVTMTCVISRLYFNNFRNVCVTKMSYYKGLKHFELLG